MVGGFTTHLYTRSDMSHPKEAWKFKLWTDAMLRGATVGDPEYGKKSGKGASSMTSKSSRQMKARRRRRRRRKNAKKVT